MNMQAPQRLYPGFPSPGSMASDYAVRTESMRRHCMANPPPNLFTGIDDGFFQARAEAALVAGMQDMKPPTMMSGHQSMGGSVFKHDMGLSAYHPAALQPPTHPQYFQAPPMPRISDATMNFLTAGQQHPPPPAPSAPPIASVIQQTQSAAAAVASAAAAVSCIPSSMNNLICPPSSNQLSCLSDQSGPNGSSQSQNSPLLLGGGINCSSANNNNDNNNNNNITNTSSSNGNTTLIGTSMGVPNLHPHTFSPIMSSPYAPHHSGQPYAPYAPLNPMTPITPSHHHAALAAGHAAAALSNQTRIHNPVIPGPSDPDTDPRELEQFAEHFKQRRIKLGVTQADVGKALANLKLPGVGSLSQSTICRFESLTLSHNNMIALKPILESWLVETEAAARNRAMKCEPGCGGGLDGGSPTPDDPLNRKRKRTSIPAHEKRMLESFFLAQPRPSGERIAAIAERLELKKGVVRVWFCNQRQKAKRLKFSHPSMNYGL